MSLKYEPASVQDAGLRDSRHGSSTDSYVRLIDPPRCRMLVCVVVGLAEALTANRPASLAGAGPPNDHDDKVDSDQ